MAYATAHRNPSYLHRKQMICETHPEREGFLAVDLPSINLKRYLCAECVSQLGKMLQGLPNMLEPWEHELRQGAEDRRVDMLDAYPSEPLKWASK